MTASAQSYGSVWFEALVRPGSPDAPLDQVDLPASVRVGTIDLDGEPGVLLAVVPDPAARFPRARHGEVGLAEGWAVAQTITSVVAADAGRATRRPIVVVVDVPGQAYGYLEELAGLHQALAAAVDALARARLAGHPVTALVVGKAISGAFLALGLQANRIVMLRHADVAVQVMSRQSTARITRRSVEQLDALAAVAPATAYDGDSFALLGAVHSTVDLESPTEPTDADLDRVRTALAEATADARTHGSTLAGRLESTSARRYRAMSRLVRDRVDAAWDHP